MTAPASPEAGAPAYAEFAVQSNFSFLRGASTPEEQVVTARRLGIAAFGLADHNTVAGVVRAWKMAQKEGLPYHPGSRLVFSDGTPDVLAYPRDREGWGHLCRMLTEANEAGEKGAPDLGLDGLMAWGDAMSLAVLSPLEPDGDAELTLLRRLAKRFGRAVRVAVAPAFDGNDRWRLKQAVALAEAAGLPLMAVGDALYHEPGRRPLQDVVTAIRLGTPVAQVGFELRAHAERHLKPPLEMARLFRRHPRALAETLDFAGELGFSLSELRYNYPDEATRDGARGTRPADLGGRGAALSRRRSRQGGRHHPP